MPGRFKSFDYYNAGGIFDAIMAIFKPLLSKKMRESKYKLSECAVIIVVYYTVRQRVSI